MGPPHRTFPLPACTQTHFPHLVGGLEDVGHLGVGHLARLGAQLVAEGQRPNASAHAAVLHHVPRGACGGRQVRGGARGHKLLAKDELLRRLTPHAHVDLGQQLLLGGGVLVAVGELAHHAQRVAARDDGGLGGWRVRGVARKWVRGPWVWGGGGGARNSGGPACWEEGTKGKTRLTGEPEEL
ncbi:hypothetical protein F751_1794 [Auxenochlorella protothecoides]|uniref:Uncharacterized protein n=1 Tax=Auxenochlorella protothecoides TaxID=3075 RepID=A0A087SGR1_AUXPR|nr:hypothetical protein F751_1794 [Auxenochlorella protothecoides]KFM24915.1 hypothetical protein F751_1794 [Auxenochlorella protothecoides]